jgi:hypothetical protein
MRRPALLGRCGRAQTIGALAKPGSRRGRVARMEEADLRLRVCVRTPIEMDKRPVGHFGPAGCCDKRGISVVTLHLLRDYCIEHTCGNGSVSYIRILTVHIAIQLIKSAK